jgi:hypothetical protein
MHVRDIEDSKATLLGCRRSNAIENLIEQFANNFSLPTSKEFL